MPRILIVDDQPAVRATIGMMLRVKGFDVVDVASAAAALKEFSQSEFDIVIIDIFLESVNGTEVMSFFRQRRPELPIIAISGVTALDFLSASPDLHDVVCLQKPFRPGDLARAVEEAMGRSAFVEYRTSAGAEHLP